MEEEEWMNVPITLLHVLPGDMFDEPIIVEAEVEEYLVRRVYVDERAFVEIMYEHCFLNLSSPIRDRDARVAT